jgi:hypothetical protein
MVFMSLVGVPLVAWSVAVRRGKRMDERTGAQRAFTHSKLFPEGKKNLIVVDFFVI